MLMLFNKQFDDCENFEELYTRYIDTSGLGKTGQLGLLTALHNLDIRIGDIRNWIWMQRTTIDLVGFPYYPGIPDLAALEYGHKIEWVNDLKLFNKKIDNIEAREAHKQSEHRMLSKELESMQKAEVPTTVNARNQFFTLLNIIGKNQGYGINKDETNMLEFSLMINDFNEEQKAIEKANNKRK